jgi:hypothetical protein
MAKLTASKKNAEPKKEFGLPEERKYPMPDAGHAKKREGSGIADGGSGKVERGRQKEDRREGE